VKAVHARITDEMVERLRQRVGRRSRPHHNLWNTQATKDAIKHFAWGIGDDNPLWVDEAYAARTIHGGIIAPPTWLYSANTGPLGPGAGPSRGTGLPGIHALHAGDSWEFFSPVHLGDEIAVENELQEPIEKASRYSGRMIQQNKLWTFRNGAGKPLAQVTQFLMSTERGTPKEYKKYAPIAAYRYSDEEREMIARQYASERPRGAAALDWADVRVGEEIPRRLKGPLTVTSMITYLMGWGSPFCMTDRIGHEYMRLHPGANVLDEPHNIRDFPERAHWDEWLWREIGFPLGYDIGTQRISWFAHLLSDWVGDAGQLKTMTVWLRDPNWLYDLTWCGGRILEKSCVAGEPTVRLELWGVNQRGHTHTTGDATVVLGNVSGLPT
jgi:acyl dehydratase